MANKNFIVKNGLDVGGTITGVTTTQSSSDNSTKLASTAYVTAAVVDLIGGAPGSLDTLNELAAAINDDASYASTLTTALATKAPLALPQFTNRVGIGVAAHGTSGLTITNTNQHIRLNNGSEVGMVSLLSSGELDLWAHGDAESINFRTGTGSGTVVMNVVGTKVGIGTATLGTNNKLTLYHGDNSSYAALALQSHHTSTGNLNGSWLGIDQSSAMGLYVWNYEAAPIRFGTSAVERMHIDSAGNVGIGTETPTEKLDVSGNITSNSTSHSYLTANSSATTTASWVQHKQGGTGRWLSGVEGSETDYQLYAGGATRLRVTAAGAVTIPGTLGITGAINNFKLMDLGSASLLITHPDRGTGTISTATHNTGFGYAAFNALTSGDYNVALGVEALAANLGGSRNIAIGTYSLSSNQTGNYNTGCGYGTLNQNTVSQNTAMGYEVMLDNTTGDNNAGLGYRALTNNLDGANNTAVGSKSLQANTSADNNTAVGYGALILNQSGSDNTAIGFGAGDATTSGVRNVYVGIDAGGGGNGSENCFIGRRAGRLATSSNTTGIGTEALQANTGAQNTAVGYQTLINNVAGTQNTAVGYFALTANVAGNMNTAMGVQALDTLNGGHRNVAVGREACRDQASGDNNTGIGTEALKLNSSGANNTAVGSYALNNHSGGNNTAVGKDAMKAAGTGGDNAAYGYRAMEALTTGNSNVALGPGTLRTMTVGDRNTALGYETLRTANVSSNADTYNTAVGYAAGVNVNTGIQNVLIGSNTGSSLQSGVGNICIGHGANTATANREYSITMGRNVASVGNYYFTFGVDADAHRVYNNFTSNASWTRASDERIKKDISTNTDCGLNFINDLRTVTYKFKAPSELDSNMTGYDASKTEALHKNKMYGFVAQEVKAAMNTHNITDFAGHHQLEDDGDSLQGISYEMFVMPLVKAVQELSAQNAALTARIETLEG